MAAEASQYGGHARGNTCWSLDTVLFEKRTREKFISLFAAHEGARSSRKGRCSKMSNRKRERMVSVLRLRSTFIVVLAVLCAVDGLTFAGFLYLCGPCWRSQRQVRRYLEHTQVNGLEEEQH